MQRGTGDQIIPLSQQAAPAAHSSICKHLSDGGLDSDTQLSNERGEIGDEGIKNNISKQKSWERWVCLWQDHITLWFYFIFPHMICIRGHGKFVIQHVQLSISESHPGEATTICCECVYDNKIII